MKGRKSLVILGIIIVALMIGLVGISFKEKNRNTIVVSASEVHQMIAEGNFYYQPRALQQSITDKEEGLMIIDLRAPNEFIGNHVEGAINIPYQRILEKENLQYFDRDQIKVLASWNESRAAEIWILLTQMGYENIYVLKGGLAYWEAKVENKNVFANINPDDEKPKFDFKKELEGE